MSSEFPFPLSKDCSSCWRVSGRQPPASSCQLLWLQRTVSCRKKRRWGYKASAILGHGGTTLHSGWSTESLEGLCKGRILPNLCVDSWENARRIQGNQNAGPGEKRCGLARMVGLSVQFSSVQSLSRVQLFVTPWTAAGQTSLSITSSWNLLKLVSIKLVMPSNHLILCRPLLLLPSIFPSIRVFQNESLLLMRWPKFWSLSFSISPSNEYSGLISFRIDWLDLLAVQGTLKGRSRVFSNTLVQKHQFFGAQLSL